MFDLIRKHPAPLTALIVFVSLSFNILAVISPYLSKILTIGFIFGLFYGLYDARRYTPMVYIDPEAPPTQGFMARMNISTMTVIRLGYFAHILLLWCRNLFLESIGDLSYDLRHHDVICSVASYAWAIILPPIFALIGNPLSFLGGRPTASDGPLPAGNQDDGDDNNGTDSDESDAPLQIEQGDNHAPRDQAQAHDDPLASLFSTVDNLFHGIVPVYRFRGSRGEVDATTRLDTITSMLQQLQASQDQQKQQADLLIQQVRQLATSAIASSAQQTQQSSNLSQQIQQLDAARTVDRTDLHQLLNSRLDILDVLERRVRVLAGSAGQRPILQQQTAADQRDQIDGLIAARIDPINATLATILQAVQQNPGRTATAGPEAPLPAVIAPNSQPDIPHINTPVHVESPPMVPVAAVPAVPVIPTVIPPTRNITPPVPIADTNIQVIQSVAPPINTINQADEADRNSDNIPVPAIDNTQVLAAAPPAPAPPPARRPSPPSSTRSSQSAGSSSGSSVNIQTEPEHIVLPVNNTIPFAPEAGPHDEPQPELSATSPESDPNSNGQTATALDTARDNPTDIHAPNPTVEGVDLDEVGTVNPVAVDQNTLPVNDSPSPPQNPVIDDPTESAPTLMFDPFHVEDSPMNTLSAPTEADHPVQEQSSIPGLGLNTGFDQHVDTQDTYPLFTFNTQPDDMEFTSTDAPIIPADTSMIDSLFEGSIVGDEVPDVEMTAPEDNTGTQVHDHPATDMEDEMEFQTHDPQVTIVDTPMNLNFDNPQLQAPQNFIFGSPLDNNPDTFTFGNPQDTNSGIFNFNNPTDTGPENPVDMHVVDHPVEMETQSAFPPESIASQAGLSADGQGPWARPEAPGTYFNPIGSNIVPIPQVNTAGPIVPNQPATNQSPIFGVPINPQYDLPSTPAYTMVGSPTLNNPVTNSPASVIPNIYRMTPFAAPIQPDPQRPASLVFMSNRPGPLFPQPPSAPFTFQSQPATPVNTNPVPFQADPVPTQTNPQPSGNNTGIFNDNGLDILQMIAARQNVVGDLRRAWFAQPNCPEGSSIHRDRMDAWVNACNELDESLELQKRRHSDMHEDIDQIRLFLQGDSFIHLPQRARLPSSHDWYDFDPTQLECISGDSVSWDECDEAYRRMKAVYDKLVNLSDSYQLCDDRDHNENADSVQADISAFYQRYTELYYRLSDEGEDHAGLLEALTQFERELRALVTYDLSEAHDQFCHIQAPPPPPPGSPPPSESPEFRPSPPADSVEEDAPAPAPLPSIPIPLPRRTAEEEAAASNVRNGMEAGVLAAGEPAREIIGRTTPLTPMSPEALATRRIARLPTRRLGPSTPTTPITSGPPPAAAPASAPAPPVDEDDDNDDSMDDTSESPPEDPADPWTIRPRTARQIRSRQATRIERRSHSPEKH